jgi:hypothetical protein
MVNAADSLITTASRMPPNHRLKLTAHLTKTITARSLA